MAKDNVPFHAIMFPATLIGINEGHTLVNYLYATGEVFMKLQEKVLKERRRAGFEPVSSG